MQPTMHLKFIAGKLHQLWVMCSGNRAEEWRLVESQ